MLAVPAMPESFSNRESNPIAPSKFKRQIIWVKRSLQAKYVFLVLFSVLVTIAVILLDIYYVTGKLLIEELGEDKWVPFIQAASENLFIHLSLYLVILLIISVFISHKFAGPLYRLERVSEAVASGDLNTKANLRKGDELYETADSINNMIESLRQKLLRERTLSERISLKLSVISNELKSGKISAKEASLNLDNVVIEVRHIVSDFKL